MDKKRIAHIMILEKFLSSFIELVDTYHSEFEHYYYFITSERYEFGLLPSHKPDFRHTDEHLKDLETELYDFDKIILHGMWRDKICMMLLRSPELLQKTFWIMWGGDYHHPELYSEEHKNLIKYVPYFISGTSEAADFVRYYYQASGEHLSSFVYPSNVVEGSECRLRLKKDNINIMLCHSGAEHIQHISLMHALKAADNNKLNYFAVLSYPKWNAYIEEVVTFGKERFGDRFNVISDFMPFSNYLDFLNKIDVALFNANRQQGTGNIVQLLAKGCRVAMNPDVTSYKYLKSKGFILDDISNVILKPLSTVEKVKNINRVRELFSLDALNKSLTAIFSINV